MFLVFLAFGEGREPRAFEARFHENLSLRHVHVTRNFLVHAREETLIDYQGQS